jgi:membrane fusion protein, multidrug efflux system
VVDETKHVSYRAVEPGELAENGLRIIHSGLKPGETVIVAGVIGVGPGAIVDPHEETPAALAAANR